MPEVENKINSQLQESLGELENAYQVNEFVYFLAEDTIDLSLKQFMGTVCASIMWNDASHGIFLSRKALSDSRREIVWFLSNQAKDTTVSSQEEGATVEDNPPITWAVEDIAKEFSKNHGLIPDLIRCLEKARKSFSNLENLVAEYDCFHSEDYEEEGHIVIRITVSSSQDTAFNEYDSYNEWMMENISDEILDSFVVTVRREE